MTQGVYRITNKNNKKSYIGSSVNIERRWVKHRATLRGNSHHNRYLQRSWNKYGEDAFEHAIVEEFPFCEDTTLRELENYFMKSFDSEYNIGKYANAPMSGRTHTKKARANISRKNKGKKHPGRGGATSPNYGNKWSDEAKKRMSLIKTGVGAGESSPVSKLKK